MAELVDALASGASALRGVEVQVLSSVPREIINFLITNIFVILATEVYYLRITNRGKF